MAIGGRSREEGVLGLWPLPLRGVVRGLNDLEIPTEALLSASNVEIIDGTLRGRRGLTQLSATTFGAKPMAALNVWESLSAAHIVMATTAKVWTYDITAGTWADRGGSLTAGADDPTRITQFAFGTPTATKAYIVNGIDAMRRWEIGDPSAVTVKVLGPELIVNGLVNSAAGWTLGANWTFDGTDFEFDHAAGDTATLSQAVNLADTITYRLTFTVRNQTAGSVTASVNGTAGVARSSNAIFTEEFVAGASGGLIFTPTSDFDGSIDDISIKKVQEDAPILRDVTVFGDRLVGLVGPYDVRWAEPLGDDDWPAANTRVLADTPAPTVGIRELGSIGLFIFKKDSVWLGELTGAPGAAAIRFTRFSSLEGPASPTALVEAGQGGPHVFMTRTGRVGLFTGPSFKWIADGVWKQIREELDQTKPNRIWGVFLPQENQVWFTYKRLGITPTDGLLIVQLERKDAGVPNGAFPGRWGKSATAGCTMQEESFNTSVIFTDVSAEEKSYTVEGTTDDGSSISSHIQPPYVPVPDLENVRILSIEPLLERLGGYGTLTVKAVTSNIIDDILGTQSTGATLDLTTVPIKEVIGVDARGRFLSTRLEWTGAATVRYRGITLRVPPQARFGALQQQQRQRGQ